MDRALETGLQSGVQTSQDAMNSHSETPRRIRILIDVCFLVACSFFAFGTKEITAELWKVVDGRPLSMKTNIMLAYPWLIYCPLILGAAQGFLDVAIKKLGLLWVIFTVINLLFFSAIATLWAVGGSSSFWKYSL